MEFQPGPVEDDITAIQKGEHAHVPNPGKVEVEKLQEEVKNRAVQSQDPPRRIVQDYSNRKLNMRRCSHLHLTGELLFSIPPTLRITNITTNNFFYNIDSGPKMRIVCLFSLSHSRFKSHARPGKIAYMFESL